MHVVLREYEVIERRLNFATIDEFLSDLPFLQLVIIECYNPRDNHEIVDELKKVKHKVRVRSFAECQRLAYDFVNGLIPANAPVVISPHWVAVHAGEHEVPGCVSEADADKTRQRAWESSSRDPSVEVRCEYLRHLSEIRTMSYVLPEIVLGFVATLSCIDFESSFTFSRSPAYYSKT